MIKTQSITFHVKHITYENGNDEVLVLTPQQYAGLKRKKGWKKTVLSNKEKALITIKIKTK